MVGNYGYPGIHVEEVSSEMRTITGVATSITAFIGRALRGPVNDPIRVQSFSEFTRIFGGLWCDSTLGYAIQHYFCNGGRDALIVRVVNENSAARATVSLFPDLILEAVDPGGWGNNLQVAIDHDTVDKDEDTPTLFNLTVKEIVEGETRSAETFGNLSVQKSHPRDLVSLLEQQSRLVRVGGPRPSARPDSTEDDDGSLVPGSFRDNGSAGGPVGFEQIGDESKLAKEHRGIWALDKADLFNLLCIPPFRRAGDHADVDRSTWSAALKYCRDRRAMLIIDPPGSWSNPREVLDEDSGVDGDEQRTTVPARDANASIYFPRIRVADPLQDNRLDTFAPCGAVAGVYARTDAKHGVWKAPAGRDATLFGVLGLACAIWDDENGQLNELGVNCLRSFPVIGNVVWGARTLRGADLLAHEWKYVPVRRLALFLEESLYRGTRWAVFEPNDEPLWAQIRAHADNFMHELFREGALEGRTPREAYFVKCDSETTSQTDIDRGAVNLLVGFAPLKPAEFIVITISQKAGNNRT